MVFLCTNICSAPWEESLPFQTQVLAFQAPVSTPPSVTQQMLMHRKSCLIPILMHGFLVTILCYFQPTHCFQRKSNSLTFIVVATEDYLSRVILLGSMLFHFKNETVSINR